jgi:starvation-inducible DNA-binding protein
MDELYELLHKTQTSLFCLFQKTWVYHWNVIGSDFYQLHELFGEQYNTMFSEIDRLTEHMRYLRMKAIGPISRVVETSEMSEATNNPTAQVMVSQLLADNKSLIEMLTKLGDTSTKLNLQATANIAADIMETHGKFVWMLRSFLKE